MPVSANTVQFSYTGDGVTTTFPFPSRFLTANDIIVGVNGVQVLSGFSVTGAGNDAGGNVVFSVAPANGTTVTLIRAPAISQLLDFVNNQTVLAQNIDNGLDKLTIIAQYLDYLLARTLRLSQFDTALSGDYDAGGKGLKNLKAPVDAADAARLSDLQGVVAGTGNVPAPTGGQIGFILKALAANSFGWVAEGNPLAPDGTLAAPGYGFASETNSGFRRASAGVIEAVVLGAAKLAFESAAVRLSTALLRTNGTLTAGTNAQGQGAMTNDQNTVTSTPNNPSGVTLPTAAAGRRITVVNRGTNPINIYPATGAAIGALAVNTPVSLPVGQTAEFIARSTTQWEGQPDQPYDADLAAIAALSRTRGDVIRGGASAWERLALGTAAQVLMSDGTDLIFANNGQYLILADEKASGTNGGTFTGGAWQTRTLNTVRTNTISGASLASNQITLPAGTYRVNTRANALRVNLHQSRLQNITDTTTTLVGTTEITEQAGAIVANTSVIWGTFTIASSKVFELQHRSQLTQLNDGFGQAASLGTEVYAMVEIQRLG